MARSLNKVILIGNLTRDPELRYTPQGTAVATFGLATNRTWTTDSGEKKDDVEFHNVVAWNKLGELASQYLNKGRRVYIEGRLQTRKWTGQDNVERRSTEVIVSDLIFLDNKGDAGGDFEMPDDFEDPGQHGEDSGKTQSKPAKTEEPSKKKETTDKKEEETEDDIPF